jgi:hypothetical protein
MSFILPCWSSCTIVGIAVEVLLVCIRSWSMFCLLPRTPISIVPSLTTTVAWSHNTRIMCIVVPLRWWRCRARRLKISMLDLTLQSLKSLRYNLHPLLLTRTENKSLRRKTITELLVVSWAPVCCIFLLRSIIPLLFSRTRALSTMSWNFSKLWASSA